VRDPYLTWSDDGLLRHTVLVGLREAVGKAVNAEQTEIARLKAELSRTRMERDILKKAAAYFAKESL
jgi:transposase-like protein